MRRVLPAPDLVRALLAYDASSGDFTWRVNRSGSALAGTIAGRVHRAGYRIISIRSVDYSAHRLAWLYVHGDDPADQIDHINGDRADNRIANLRPATNAQNRANSRRPANNTSGIKGVHFFSGKWIAVIGYDGDPVYLGSFASLEAAGRAYAAAATRLFGEYARVA